MIIQSSSVSMSVTHEQYEYRRVVGEQSLFGDGSVAQGSFAELVANAEKLQGISFNLADQAPPRLGILSFAGLFSSEQPAAEEATPTETIQSLENQLLDVQGKLIDALLATLAGKPQQVEEGTEQLSEQIAELKQKIADMKQAQADGNPDGVEAPLVTIQMMVNVSEYVKSSETTNFAAMGVVKTADGKEIDLALNMTMARTYEGYRQYQESRTVVLKDPLVLNFAGNAAELTEEHYQFDIDADGEMDEVQWFTGDSAALVLDKNQDGTINDGSEVFGGVTGNGFAELAKYDEDGNGYIDSADSVFDQLQLWRKMAGEDQFSSLEEQDVGAIYLGATDSPYEIRNEENETRARVAASSFYLTEAGEVGSVQQVDLAV